MLSPTALELALLSAGVLGFRHGFDYDHIAAISDITSVEPSRKRAMRMGLVYVIGHASTVALLGGAVILFQKSLPARIDGWAERAVGFTLVLLGLYVLLIAYGYIIALTCRNQFGRLVAFGLTVSFFLYVFVNVAMVTGLIPVVGIPLPLVSYGGTAMLTLLIGCGLLLGISVHREVRISRTGISD